MKKRLITILMAVFILTLGTAPLSFATGSTDGYHYKVNIYTGNQGQFANGTKEKTWTLAPGESIGEVLTINDVKVTDDKYYVRGFRIAGHDNDEISGFTGFDHITSSSDASYEVAYGIKGDLVAYTVRYVDDGGRELMPSDTYYGMPGDKPVASYRYIEGYEPNAYYIGGTLKSDSENVFTFTYSRGDAGQNGQNGNDGNGGNGANGNGANGNGAGAVNAVAGPAAPGTAANPAGTNTPNNTVTIGDNDTPLANGPDQYLDLDDEGGVNWTLFGILGAVAALVIAALIFFLLKRRKDSEEPSEDDDSMYIG